MYKHQTGVFSKTIIIMSLPASVLDILFAPDSHIPLGSLHQKADPGALWFLAGLPSGRKQQETGGAGGERGGGVLSSRSLSSHPVLTTAPSSLTTAFASRLLLYDSGAHCVIITPFLPSAPSDPGEETIPATAHLFTLHSAHLREEFLHWTIQGKHHLLLDPE